LSVVFRVDSNMFYRHRSYWTC